MGTSGRGGRDDGGRRADDGPVAAITGADVTTGDELEDGAGDAIGEERGRGGGPGKGAAAFGEERAAGNGSGTGGSGAGVMNAVDGGGATIVFSPGVSSGSAVIAMA